MPHVRGDCRLAQALARVFVASIAATACLAVPTGKAQAETRTVRIIVPSTPGGGADILARLMSEYIGRNAAVSMIVENRPGAGNTIGTEAVARAAPDGNTVLVTTPEFVINSHLKKLTYDPLADFVPVCYLARSVQVIVANGAAPYRNLNDLIAAAHQKPGELTIASTGPASSPHIAIETLKRLAKADILYVPYPGTAPAINALLGQHLTAVFASYPNVSEQLKSGALRALAVASKTRIDELPGVAAVAESGFPNFEADIWFGIVAPAHTPKDAVDQLAGWLTAALALPEVKSKLEVQGLFPVGLCGDRYGAFLTSQFKDYGDAIRAANIKVQ